METTQHMLIPRDITAKGVAELMIYRSKKSGLVEYMLKKARNSRHKSAEEKTVSDKRKYVKRYYFC